MRMKRDRKKTKVANTKVKDGAGAMKEYFGSLGGTIPLDDLCNNFSKMARGIVVGMVMRKVTRGRILIM